MSGKVLENDLLELLSAVVFAKGGFLKGCGIAAIAAPMNSMILLIAQSYPVVLVVPVLEALLAKENVDAFVRVQLAGEAPEK